MTKILYLFVGIFLFANANAQTPQLNWVKFFNGKSASTDSSSVMKMNILDNSVYIAGTSNAYGKANDIVLIKRDYTTGDTLWTRHYNGPANGDDQAVDMEINQTTGDVYLVGKCTGLSTGYDVITLNYSSAGQLKWLQRWDNQKYHGDDIPVSIGIDFGGRIFVTGTTFNGNTSLNDLFVHRYESNGILNFDYTNFYKDPYSFSGGYSADFAGGARVNNLGQIYIAGEFTKGEVSNGWSTVYAYAMSSSFYESYTAECTDKIFSTSAHYSAFPMNYFLSPNDFNYFNAMELDNSNNLYLAYLNDTIIGQGSNYRMSIVKINGSGCTQWERKTGHDANSKNLRVKVIKTDSNGNVYATGYEKNSSNDFDWFFIKYNSAGVFQWRVTKKGTANGNDIPNDIAFDNLQNPIVVGVTKNTGTNNDITFVKYNKTNGAELFSVNYDSVNGDEKAYNIIVDASQKIIINGIVNTTAQSQNMITLRYCNPPAAAGVISGTTILCQGQNSITYSVPEIDNTTSYLWTLPTGATGTSTTNSITVTFSAAAISGNISVKGQNDCSDGTSSSLPIVINPIPATPIVTLVGNALRSNATTGNQWYNQTGAVNGATSQDYTPIASGNYYVVVSVNGCSSNSSNIISYIPTRLDFKGLDQSVKIYPNPVTDNLTISVENNTGFLEFEIIDAQGIGLIKGNMTGKSILDVSDFKPGFYCIKIKTGDVFEVRKFIKN